MHRNVGTDIELFHALLLFPFKNVKISVALTLLFIEGNEWKKSRWVRDSRVLSYTHELTTQAKAVKVFINIHTNPLCHARPNLRAFKHAPTHNLFTLSRLLLCFCCWRPSHGALVRLSRKRRVWRGWDRCDWWLEDNAWLAPWLMITPSESDTAEKKHEVRKWLWRAKTNDSHSDITHRPMTRNGAMRAVREIELLPAFFTVMNNAPFTQASELHFTPKLMSVRRTRLPETRHRGSSRVCIRDPSRFCRLDAPWMVYGGCFHTDKHTL